MADPRPLVVNLDPGRHLICRCGQTQNPPFCDRSHRRFRANPAKPPRKPDLGEAT